MLMVLIFKNDCLINTQEDDVQVFFKKIKKKCKKREIGEGK